MIFFYFDRDTGYIFSIPRARAAASWGRVGPRDATASARATRNPAYAGPGFGAAPGARLAPPRLARGAFCGHEDHLGQVQSPRRSREAIKNFDLRTALSGTVPAAKTRPESGYFSLLISV